MKKIINNPENVVEEMLKGICCAHPEYLKKLDNFNVLVRKDLSKRKVAIVSGGGSGHEPAHGGYVGYGMLDAAVPGDVFTSPAPDQIYEAIKAVDRGRGVLLVIKNYSGDVMNFEMAKDMAEMDGIKVDYVIANDDVAVENSTFTTGRRGIAGTVFVHKIAGAAAEKGLELTEVKRIAVKVVKNVRSMGMALSPCVVPAVGNPNFTLAEDEIEVGIGIHGEPGTHREKIKSADEIVDVLLEKVLDDIDIKAEDKVSVMINGLGSTPLMELYIANGRVNRILHENDIQIHRTFVGEYMTSLEMAGFSITVLKLDDELEGLLDYRADTPALKVI